MEKRTKRLAEWITAELMDILRGLKDPRMKAMVSIVRTEVNRDHSQARVYLSLYGPDEAVAETLEAIERAKGHIRSELARRLPTYHCPELVFVPDDSIAFQDMMTRLLRKGGAEEEGNP